MSILGITVTIFDIYSIGFIFLSGLLWYKLIKAKDDIKSKDKHEK